MSETSERTQTGATIPFKSSEQLSKENPETEAAPHLPRAQAPVMPELAEGGVKVFAPASPEKLPETVSAAQLADECRARIAAQGRDPGDQ